MSNDHDIQLAVTQLATTHLSSERREALETLLKSSDFWVVVGAFYGLQNLSDPQSLPALREFQHTMTEDIVWADVQILIDRLEAMPHPDYRQARGVLAESTDEQGD